MHIMFRGDMVVLGLSDGVMFATTGFGLFLQKAIHRGYITWNREGWIIQSVSFTSLVPPIDLVPYSRTPMITRVCYRSGRHCILYPSSAGLYIGSGNGHILSSSSCMGSSS
jgi:hypothetical protein